MNYLLRTTKMKFGLLVTLSMGVIFAAQTASVPGTDEESNAIGYVEITEERGDENGITERKEIHFVVDNATDCESPKANSLDDLWSEHFETAYALLEIKRDQQLAEQVMEILRHPFKTAQRIKTELQPILSTEQYEKIRMKVPSPLKIVSQDDNQVYDHDTSNQFEASNSNFMPDVFPNDSDPEGSTESQKNTQHSKHEVHSRKDPILVTTFDDLTKSIQKPPGLSPGVEKNLEDFVARYVAKELAHVIEKEETEPQSREPSSDSSTSSHLDHAEIPTQTEDYTLPDIDKSLIDNLDQGPIDRTWQGTDYQVRFKRNSPEGDIELWWKKGTDDIYLHAFANGAADQNWGFGDVHIGLFRDEHHSQIQVWNFGDTKLEYIKDNTSSLPQRTWEYGNRDEASYWKYRHVIKLWCNANDFFVGKEFCVIY